MENQKNQKEKYHILSVDGSRLIGGSYCIRDAKGRLDWSKFEGYFDRSLETVKLEAVCKKHKTDFPHGFKIVRPTRKNDRQEDLYSLAFINVSFNYAWNSFRRCKTAVGYLFVLDGVSREEAVGALRDHVALDTDGSLIGIEVPYNPDRLKDYAPVENVQAGLQLDGYFAYDVARKCYVRTRKPFPQKKSKAEIRKELYCNGFYCDGIHYIRYKRSAGSSREGQCLFIPDVLYDDMMTWSSCGIDGNTVKDQASFQAYIALTLSSIQDLIPLPKKSILILKDAESVFEDEAVCVRRNERDTLDAEIGKVEIRNKIWDGEALLDESVFEANGYGRNGMMLLRNRFFKTCAFNTKLQKWFRDKGITDIKQLNGYWRRGAALEDIKLVITESSLKYCKMLPGMTLEEKFNKWLSEAFEGNTSYFGLVKTEKKTAFMDGQMVLTNYQLLNTLGLNEEEVEKLLAPSFEYLHNIRDDPMYLRHYIRIYLNADENDVSDETSTMNYRAKAILEMLKRRDDFTRTKFFSDFRGDILTSFKRMMKSGRIRVDGTYATLFGNGAEYLHALTDKNFDFDAPKAAALEGNEIRTTQFAYDQELLCSRSPHITMGNLFVARNQDCDIYRDYFNFENVPEIVCINAIGYNIQQRLNGCDYDSDTMLITDQELMLSAAKQNLCNFPVPIADFSPEDTKPGSYDLSCPETIANLDRIIAENRIGEIVNLSQFLNSLYWDRIASGKSHDSKECRDLYGDICKLAVLSGIEIDKAKRANPVDAGKTLRELCGRRTEYRKAHNGKVPAFYSFLTEKEERGSDATLRTTMSYVYDLVDQDTGRAPYAYRLKLSDLVDLDPQDKDLNNDSHRKSDVLDKVRDAGTKMAECHRRLRSKGRTEEQYEMYLMEECFDEAVEEAARKIVNDHVLILLLKELDDSQKSPRKKKPDDPDISAYASLLFAVILFENNHRFLNRVIRQAEKKEQFDLVHDLKRNKSGETYVWIYGHPHFKRKA